ncbi:MAG: BCD family MFS transporter [Pseudomonadota bacterium]
MTTPKRNLSNIWTNVGARFLPFADAASDQLPLGRLLRLSLFQVSVGMALALVTGVLNRVMIVELFVPAWLVALMVALPLAFAPFRALIGHKSDTHRSALGWRRSPYIWLGSLLQFGGLAIMPFALLILSGDTHGPAWIGHASAALAFLLVGAGLHTTQTAGLALATDLAPADARPRVVALLYVMLLAGMGASAVVFGALLSNFDQLKLIQVVQGAAVATVVLNVIALWKQERRNPSLTAAREVPSFSEAWRGLAAQPGAKRLLIAVGLGAAAFSMQDVLLEPYGGEILSLSVSETTMLTALFAGGSLIGFAVAARRLTRGGDPYRLAAFGALAGVFAFSAIIFAEPFESPLLFRIGAALVGFGGGLFSVCTLTAIMAFAKGASSGIALGAWGAVQATAAGVAIAMGGAIRDIVSALAGSGALGPALNTPAAGYSAVYHIEILLLFATIAAIGPLARYARHRHSPPQEQFGLSAFPG